MQGESNLMASPSDLAALRPLSTNKLREESGMELAMGLEPMTKKPRTPRDRRSQKQDRAATLASQPTLIMQSGLSTGQDFAKWSWRWDSNP
jgi:hypothetical protein